MSNQENKPRLSASAAEFCPASFSPNPEAREFVPKTIAVVPPAPVLSQSPVINAPQFIPPYPQFYPQQQPMYFQQV